MAIVHGYLALCLPATLATTINTAVATADIRATATTPENPVPGIVINPSRSAEIDLEQPVPDTPRLAAGEAISGALSDVERQIDPAMGRRIQAALCVTQDADFGSETREAIRLYRRALLVPTNHPTLDAPLTLAEANTLQGTGPCAGPSGYRTAYERFRFRSEEDIKGLQMALAERTERAVPQSGRFDEETREAIRTLSQRLGIGDTEVVTPELSDQLAA